MSSPLLIVNKTLTDNQLINTDAVYNSESFDISGIGSYAVQFIFTTSAAVLNVAVGVSNDNINFTQTNQITFEETGTAMVQATGAHYRYVRIEANRDSGTSHLTAILTGKQS